MIKSLLKKIVLRSKNKIKVQYIDDLMSRRDCDLSCLRSSHSHFNHKDHKSRRDVKRINVVTAFHQDWLHKRDAVIKSPFSKTFLSTIASHTLYIDTYHCVLYEYFDKYKFYLIVGDYWFEKLGLYLPHSKEVLLCRPTPIDIREMLQIFSFKNTLKIKQPRLAPNQIGLVMYHDHLAHHIMNELNGIQQLISNDQIKKVDKLYYCTTPYGSLQEIFPEIPKDKLHKVSRAKINSQKIKENTLILPYQTVRLAQETINRLISYSSRKNPTLVEHITNKKQDYDLRIWISIRTGNRVLDNQIHLLKEIIKELESRGLSVIFIVDGYSKPYEVSERETGYYKEIIIEEKKIISQLKSASLPYLDLVDQPIDEVILWTQAANCYLCHSGTLHHKISWFADIPGLVHSNKYFSDLPNHLLPGMTEKKWKHQPVRVPPFSIKDLKTAAHSRSKTALPEKFNNYELIVEATKELFLQILRDNGLV